MGRNEMWLACFSFAKRAAAFEWMDSGEPKALAFALIFYLAAFSLKNPH